MTLANAAPSTAHDAAAAADPDAPIGEAFDEDKAFTVPTHYWHRDDQGRVQCDLCPRHCRLHKGQRGMCFVRARGGEEDGIILTTYGRSTGFCIDPVEKKPLNHFLPGTPILSFGTAGCNLQCKFCQNWSSSKSRQTAILSDHAPPEKVARIAAQTGCRSVAFTYNDPTIFMEYAIDIAEACHARDIRTVAVTAGYICPEPRALFYRHLDAANIDLKAFNKDFYRKLTKSELDPVLDTLRYVKHETDCWLEITTLLIPGENDSDAELHTLSAWIRDNLGTDVPLHFSAFHPDYRMLDKPRTPSATLIRARQIALEEGLPFVYVGNVSDPGRASTYCATCGCKLIGRDRYDILSWDLTPDGLCPACQTPLPGRFEAQPGDWGTKRMAVRMANFPD